MLWSLLPRRNEGEGIRITSATSHNRKAAIRPSTAQTPTEGSELKLLSATTGRAEDLMPLERRAMFVIAFIIL